VSDKPRRDVLRDTVEVFLNFSLLTPRSHAGINAVLKKLMEGSPEGGGHGRLAEDEVQDPDGDSCVDPLNNGEIIFDPRRIIRARNGVSGNMMKKIASTEVNIEEITPRVIVVDRKI
jgi:hypothetical protein